MKSELEKLKLFLSRYLNEVECYESSPSDNTINHLLDSINWDAKILIKAIKKDYFSDGLALYDHLRECLLFLSALKKLDNEGFYLTNIALDNTIDIYIRINTIYALHDIRRTNNIKNLIPLLERNDLNTQFISAVLDLLSQRGYREILPIINSLSLKTFDKDIWWDKEEKLLLARCALGDLDYLRELLELRYKGINYCEYYYEEFICSIIYAGGGLGSAVSSLLEKKFSEKTIIDQLILLSQTDRQGSVRRWAIDVLDRIVPITKYDIFIENLKDPEWLVTEGASQILSKRLSSKNDLFDLVSDRNAYKNQRLWAIKTLFIINEKITKESFDDIDELYVPWPFDFAYKTRPYFINKYGLLGGPGTDVRYIIEYYVKNYKITYDVDSALNILVKELYKNDIQYEKPIHCDDYHKHGSGNYWMIKLSDAWMYLSSVGPFVTIMTQSNNTSSTAKNYINAYTNIISDIKFNYLNKLQLDNIVPGYSYESVKFGDLFFYWNS